MSPRQTSLGRLIQDRREAAGSITDDEARLKYPDGWKTVKPYLRIVPQPQG